MPHFNVDDELTALIEKLAQLKPAEKLTFNSALRRALKNLMAPEAQGSIETLKRIRMDSLTVAESWSGKSHSPNPQTWAAQIPELSHKKGLNTWKSICEHLKIDSSGGSARRILKQWVSEHKKEWPEVPDIHRKSVFIPKYPIASHVVGRNLI